MADTMRALVLEAPGRIEVRQIPVPEPGPGEILLRVRAATTCGTDLKAYRRGHPQIPMPGPFGHEYAGEVVAAGADAPFATGQAVVGVHSAPCRACDSCRRGQENLCESSMATKILGSFAEFLLVPERIARTNLFDKPASMPFEIASLLEPLSCVAQGVLEMERLGSVSPQANVLVIGPGAIGLMFVAALRARGVEQVTLAGRNPARLAVGERLGARARRLEELDQRPEFDVVIECTGQVEVWERSVSSARRGGLVVLFGGCPSGTCACFDTGRLHYDQITLFSPFHFGTAAVRQAREWLLSDRMDLSPIVGATAELEEAERVFQDLADGRMIKVAFRP